jgi:hypothetical protein
VSWAALPNGTPEVEAELHLHCYGVSAGDAVVTSARQDLPRPEVNLPDPPRVP